MHSVIWIPTLSFENVLCRLVSICTLSLAHSTYCPWIIRPSKKQELLRKERHTHVNKRDTLMPSSWSYYPTRAVVFMSTRETHSFVPSPSFLSCVCLSCRHENTSSCWIIRCIYTYISCRHACEKRDTRMSTRETHSCRKERHTTDEGDRT